MATKNKSNSWENTYTAKIDNYYGADFSSPLLKVESYRAVDMANFIMKDNVNQVRNGYKELIKMPVVSVDQEGYRYLYNEIYGMWSFIASDNKSHIIVHYGSSLYEVELNKGLHSYTLISKGFTLDRFKSSGAISNKRLYLFVGDLLVVYYDETEQKLKTKRVQDDVDTTIPTTTTGITEEGSKSPNRVSFEDVNLMTKWRINTLLSHTLSDEIYNQEGGYIVNINNPIKFVLDGKINLRANYGADTTSIVYSNVSRPKLVIEYLDENNDYVKLELEGVESTLNGIIMPCYKFVDDSDTVIAIICNFDLFMNNTPLTDKYFHTFKASDTANLYVYKDFIPPIEGRDNISITFDGSYGNSVDMITGCRFCIPYGYGTNRDTLFASGNPNYPNMVFHTANNAKDTYKSLDERFFGDFTYWSDLDYIALGSSENAVANLTILGDGTLCAMKTSSFNEPTIYYITGTLLDATTYDGTLIEGLQEIKYLTKVGSIGESLYENDKTLLNLNGDTLFLSNHGLYGLTQSSNLNSSQRYSHSRSRLVNKRLLTEDLKNASAIVYDNKYLLSFADTGHVYVFDSRYSTQLEDELENDFQYECWLLTDINANGFIVLNDKLYFYTKNGEICELFIKDTYYDEKLIDIETGDMIVDNDNHCLALNNYITNRISNDSTLVINEEDYIYKYIPSSEYEIISQASNSFVIISRKSLNGIIFEDDIVCVQTPTGIHKINRIVNYEDDIDNYQLFYEDSTTAKGGLVLAILKMLKNGEEYRLKLSEIDFNEEDDYEKNYWLIDKMTNEKMPIYQITSTPVNESYFRTIVDYEAYYITKLFDFDTNVFVKTISSLTLTSDHSLKSSCQFGYRTSYSVDYSYTFNYGNVIGIDYNDYDYTDVVYDPNKDFAQSYTYPSRIRNFNYIQFAFKKNGRKNCALSSLSIIYQIGTRKRGLN